MTKKSYSELILLPTFAERFNYLKIGGDIGEQTFGGNRYLNQAFYKSREWQFVRDCVIARDFGNDLGIEGRQIFQRVIIHHINPISLDDIRNRSNALFDMDNLICCSDTTHKAIHYGSMSILQEDYVARSKNDTCPWKRG